MPSSDGLPTSELETESRQDPGRNREAQPQFPVVAIGASAGGLEAFTDLLRRLPPAADPGMAFVFIQHLSPDHDSMLAQLLSRETTMPVTQVVDGTVLAPNQVYVIPPNAAMTISGDGLVLRPRETAATVIDAFLRSLAESRQGAAIGVILSGTGSDGALGVQAIAEEGGVVFAQDPASAKFDGMPRSAIATGCVDFVLPPGEIAAELARIASEPHVIACGLPEGSRQSPHFESAFQALLDLLHADTGIDFSLYRQSTVRRRVLRRLGLLRLGSLADYVEHARMNPDELHSLAQDILIRVTRFFRDPEAFEALGRRVFPALIRKTPPDSSVRIWAPGCSTGEEAYSIAIRFHEVAEQMGSRVPVQIFATDINEAAIEKARRGTYIENIVADVSEERLARYFVKAGKEFQVSRTLRDQCIFSRHDLLNDPPFSRMDLVSCRNVLIYLESVHLRALSRFHFALNPGGFLLLGKSETAASSPELFAPLDKEARLYVRQESTRQPAYVFASRKKASIPRSAAGASLGAPAPRRLDLRRQADRIVAERYSSPQVIVDGNLDAVDSRGETGASSPDLLEQAKQGHADALRNAILAAGNTGQPVAMESVKLAEGASPEVRIEITPLGPERQHFLVVFAEQPGQPAPDVEPAEPATASERRGFETRIGLLEKELASSRGRLESVIVEQEAASEEIVASNEELQSLNEELESSKEELEATDEELTTVNQELQVRNIELENAREFAQATIDTVRSSLVVLGRDLRVLKANEVFYRTFLASPAEVEHRFVYELAGGHWSDARLRELLEEVLPQNHKMEDFEFVCEVPPLGRRTLLLNACRFERQDRILLAIEDVTESRRAAEEQRQSQKMEAIGYLAAGVAHDFNNLLTGIMGNASLLLESMREDGPNRTLLHNVVGGAQTAADLTRQLLAYAGKGRFYLERLHLSEVVVKTAKLLTGSIPASVQLRLDLDKDLPLLLADPSQMQQVVMNLIINAAEAIGSAGGAVRVRTGRRTITADPLPDLYPGQQVAPGEYVFLEVLDNGSGMDEATIRRIFDPFFSTKFLGRGLGLAAVLGIVRQQKGAMQVHSFPGRGTAFTVSFPAGEKAEPPIATDAVGGDLRGSGIVLVVDDEEMIRRYTKSALESLGYTVLLAKDGREAGRLVRARPSEIALVLLDMAMPDMDGIQTLKRIREIRPDLPVVVCSGLGEMDVEGRFAGTAVAGFLSKPYTVRQLAGKVKDCIAPAASSAGGAMDPGK
jgi:two-component system CheB/CheR fusion protein